MCLDASLAVGLTVECWCVRQSHGDVMELARYVGDRLHDLLGISDKYVAEYFIGLAGKSSSAASFIEQLRDTDTVTVDDAMMSFARELWNKVNCCQCFFYFYLLF